MNKCKKLTTYILSLILVLGIMLQTNIIITRAESAKTELSYSTTNSVVSIYSNDFIEINNIKYIQSNEILHIDCVAYTGDIVANGKTFGYRYDFTILPISTGTTHLLISNKAGDNITVLYEADYTVNPLTKDLNTSVGVTHKYYLYNKPINTIKYHTDKAKINTLCVKNDKNLYDYTIQMTFNEAYKGNIPIYDNYNNVVYNINANIQGHIHDTSNSPIKIVLDEEPTCEHNAIGHEVLNCSICGEEIVGEPHEIPNSKLNHHLVYYAEVETNCLQEGHMAYYQCENCHKYFRDGEGKEEITEMLGTPPLLNRHTLVHHEAKGADCLGGNREYWQCSVCLKLFADENAETEIENPTSIVIPPDFTKHKFKYVEAKEADCLHKGNLAYYECENCHIHCTDANGNNIISDSEMTNYILPLDLGKHNLVKTNAKAPTLTATGNKAYWTCTKCGKIYLDADATKEITSIAKVKIDKLINIKTTTISISQTSYVYTGSAIKPKVTVKNGKNVLKSGTDYTVSYAKNTNVGTATITITGKGKYGSTTTKTFKIVPKITPLRTLTIKNNSITVTWTPQTMKMKTSYISGYQVQYSTSKSFTNSKTVNVAKYSTKTTTIKNLVKGKTYYVRIRTYKAVNGNKYYSKWGTSKSIKVK